MGGGGGGKGSARFRFPSPQAPWAYFSPLPISQPVRKNKEASAEERVDVRKQSENNQRVNAKFVKNGKKIPFSDKSEYV